MKSNISLITILVCFLCCSCDREAVGPVYNGESGFAFASPVLNVEAVSEDKGQIIVPVHRGTATVMASAEVKCEYDVSPQGSSEYKWSDVSPDGIFSLVSSTVLFADGQYSSNLYLRYQDIEKLGIGVKYRLRLTLLSGVSPSDISKLVVTVSRKLTYEKIGDCLYYDSCIFDNAYTAEIYKAKEADIYRVKDPYTKGLIAEDYASEGWLGKPDAYVQFTVDKDGMIRYEPLNTGMLVNGLHSAYAYYPSEYKWGKDFSEYDTENKKISDTEFQLYPVYCLPSFQYGFLNEGAYKLTVTLCPN